jgi:adenylate kinase family enzyme
MYSIDQASGDGYDLSIQKIDSSKDEIQQPELAKHDKMFIPPLGSSVIISGKSGSGKSTLLANLITDGRFYGKSKEKPNGWFKKIFLFSPTANGDDIQKALGIPKKYVFTDLDEAPELLEVILDSQQKKVDNAEGAHKVDQFCIIFDDVIGNKKFMNSKDFTRCFYQVRHVNCTTFICTQHFHRVPNICRLQANFVFFFQGSAYEVNTVVEDYSPPMYSRKDFESIVNDATKNKHSFLTINMKVGWDLRLRRNLDQFIHLSLLDASDDTPQKQEKQQRKRNYDDTANKLSQDLQTTVKRTLQARDGPEKQTNGRSAVCDQTTTRERPPRGCDSATKCS